MQYDGVVLGTQEHDRVGEQYLRNLFSNFTHHFTRSTFKLYKKKLKHPQNIKGTVSRVGG
jgi:hypothetical protein